MMNRLLRRDAARTAKPTPRDRILEAMHAYPARRWTAKELSQVTGMGKTKVGFVLAMLDAEPTRPVIAESTLPGTGGSYFRLNR